MTISYTTYFEFALLDTGDSEWGSEMNSMLTTLDKAMQEASDPLIWDDNTNGRIDGSEILTFDGDVLGWA